MTGSYVLSPRAHSDLDDIWNRTESRWGIDQAETYTRQLWQHIEAVAAQPTLGRACPEIRAGYCKYASGSHVIFYRPTAGGVDVVRILHERLDFERPVP